MEVLRQNFRVDNQDHKWLHSYLASGTHIFSTAIGTADAVVLISRVPQGSVVDHYCLLYIQET